MNMTFLRKLHDCSTIAPEKETGEKRGGCNQVSKSNLNSFAAAPGALEQRPLFKRMKNDGKVSLFLSLHGRGGAVLDSPAIVSWLAWILASFIMTPFESWPRPRLLCKLMCCVGSRCCCWISARFAIRASEAYERRNANLQRLKKHQQQQWQPPPSWY